MTKSKFLFWIDADGKGFYGTPKFPHGYVLPKNCGPDLACAYALDCAKRGDFSYIASLLDFYRITVNPQLDNMILGTITYAGPAICFTKIVNYVIQNNDLRIIIDLCGTMAERGELSYVPIFLKKYMTNIENQDADYLLDYISHLLGTEFYFDDSEELEIQVLESYHKLLLSLGSEKSLVFKGQIYSVNNLAKYILEAVKQPFFQSSLRRSFEAATGIDCSSWYKNKLFQPLAATAILEEFLESSESKNYKMGVRYFFGHEIPQ